MIDNGERGGGCRFGCSPQIQKDDLHTSRKTRLAGTSYQTRAYPSQISHAGIAGDMTASYGLSAISKI